MQPGIAHNKVISGSMYFQPSKQVFLWEGTDNQRPSAAAVTEKLENRAIAHELGHLFLHLSGHSVKSNYELGMQIKNLAEDFWIDNTNNWLRGGLPLFYAGDLPEDFNYDRDVPYPPKAWEAKQMIQLYRLGASRVAKYLNR